MNKLAAGYWPGHITSMTCWCRPRALTEYGKTFWIHRHVMLRPDDQPRAFQSILVGPPVP